MVSFADSLTQKRELPSLTGGITSVFSNLTGPKAMPNIDYSGNKPISSADLKDLTNFGQKLGAMSAASSGGPTTAKHSLMGDAMRAANPLDIRSIAATGLAMMAGLSPVLVAAAGLAAGASNFIHAPAAPSAKHFTPTVSRDARQKPPSLSSYGYSAKSDSSPYSSWADAVAPIAAMTAAPAALPMGPKPKAAAPTAPAQDEKFQAMLSGQMREFQKVQDGVAALTKGSTMNALAPDMMTESTWARMDTNDMHTAARHNGRVSLEKTGVPAELTDKLGKVDFKPTKVQQMALTLG